MSGKLIQSYSTRNHFGPKSALQSWIASLGDKRVPVSVPAYQQCLHVYVAVLFLGATLNIKEKRRVQVYSFITVIVFFFKYETHTYALLWPKVYFVLWSLMHVETATLHSLQLHLAVSTVEIKKIPL